MTALQPSRIGARPSDAEALLEANARATRALVSAATAIGFAACSVSILAALAIDALIGWGVAAWVARLSVAAALGLPALVLARQAAAQLQRRTSLPLETLQRILAEAGQPTRPWTDDGPGSEGHSDPERAEGHRDRTDRRLRSNPGTEAGPLA